jgi:hypothetical protein
MVDQLDRDFELVSHNTHPFQLFAYEVNNRSISKLQENYETQKRGEETFEEKMIKYIEYYTLKKFCRWRRTVETWKRISSSYQSHWNRSPLFQKGKSWNEQTFLRFPVVSFFYLFIISNPDGSINDFLEIRRPFVAPNPNTVSSWFIT